MDKLEFDARLTQLERRVAFLSAFLVAAIVLVGASAFFWLRGESRSQAAVAIPQAVAHAAPEPALHPVGMVDVSDGTVGHLVMKLDELVSLQQKGLLTPEEFQAKKAKLIDESIQSSNLTSDLEQLAGLLQRNVITAEEHQDIKTRVLGTGKRAK